MSYKSNNLLSNIIKQGNCAGQMTVCVQTPPCLDSITADKYVYNNRLYDVYFMYDHLAGVYYAYDYDISNDDRFYSEEYDQLFLEEA